MRRPRSILNPLAWLRGPRPLRVPGLRVGIATALVLAAGIVTLAVGVSGIVTLVVGVSGIGAGGPHGLGTESARRPPVDEPRCLELATPEISLGRLHSGEERRAVLRWRRRGRGRLRVLRIRSACGCALVDALPKELPEGAAGSLGVRFIARDTPGPQRHRIRIVTDAEAGLDVLDAWVGGHVQTDVAITPSRVVLAPGQGGTEITAAIEVRWDRASVGALVPLARLVGLAGRVDVLPPASPGADACQIVFHVRRPEAPGRARGWLALDLGPRGPVAVPIEGVVYPRRAEAGDAPPR